MKRSILAVLAVCLILFSYGQTGPHLLGCMSEGGTNANGTIISYTGGDSTVSIQFNFPVHGNNGTLTTVNPTETPDGNLYIAGGSPGGLLGTIYKYDMVAGTYTPMVSFNSTYSNITGYSPVGSLLLASDGLMYGMNGAGGAHGGGTIFSYAAGDTFVTKLADLPAGAQPNGSLMQASDGNLYGLTWGDGTNSSGTLFQYDIAAATYTVLHNLPTDAWPEGGRLLEAGADTLYGETQADGTHGGGTIFRYVIAPGAYTVLYNFDTNAANPNCNLLRASDGNMYGMTKSDGSYGRGTLFSYNVAANSYTVRHVFGFGIDGTVPGGNLLQASNGILYGTTYGGGLNGLGTIFQYNISDSLYTKKVDLTNATGSNPHYGNLLEYVTPPSNPTIYSGAAACTGTTASFSASTMGIGATPRWQVSTDGGATFSNIPGAADTIYSITASYSQNAFLYRAIFTNLRGSDTTSTAELNVYAPATDTIMASTCPGTGYSFGAHIYYAAGSYTDTMPGASVYGCDSVVTLLLTLYSSTSTVAATFCPGSVYTLGANTYGLAGTYYDTLTGASVYGCDSIITLTLSMDSVTAYFILQPSNTPHLWYIVNQCTGNSLTYVWNWGDSTTNSTGDTPSHTYADTGYYNVCVTVTDSMGCTASYCDTNVYLFKDQSGQMVYVEVLTQYPTGINTITTTSLNINYHSGAIHFSEAIQAPTQLRLYDLSGRVVKAQDNFAGNKWDINSGLAQGVYILHLQNDSYSLSQKLPIIQ